MVEVAGNKEFGSVFLQQGGQQENVALSVVQNGWAKVGGDSLQYKGFVKALTACSTSIWQVLREWVARTWHAVGS